MDSNTYCLREKKFTKDINPEIITTKNNRKRLSSTCASCGAKKSKILPLSHKGGNVDIHKLIGKLTRPKGGFTPFDYKYLGPYNPLESQLEHDDEGNITKFHVQPKNKVDRIAAEHDVYYTIGRNKGDCDREMVSKLDALPYGEVPKMGMLARNIINTKQKLGLGLKKRLASDASR